MQVSQQSAEDDLVKKAIEESKKDVLEEEFRLTDEQLLATALRQSKEESVQEVRRALDQGLKEMQANEAVKAVMQMQLGISYDIAMQGFLIYGSDPDAIVNYFYDKYCQ